MGFRPRRVGGVARRSPRLRLRFEAPRRAELGAAKPPIARGTRRRPPTPRRPSANTAAKAAIFAEHACLSPTPRCHACGRPASVSTTGGGVPRSTMQLARRASARPPANLPGSQRAPTPVDSHLVDGRTSTDRDVLACHLARPRGTASLRPPAKLRNADHPPAAVAGDIDIEAGHWSPSLDEAVEVFTQEHKIGQAPVQRPSGHAIVGSTPVARKPGGRPTVARKL